MSNIDVKRVLDPADLAEIGELIATSTRHDGRPTLNDSSLRDLLEPGPDGFIALLARDEALPGLLAYAHLHRRAERFALELLIRPGHRSPALAGELVEHALSEVGRAGGGEVEWWAGEDGETVATLSGFRPERVLHRMRRALSAQDARGAGAAPTRPFVVGRDESALLALNNAAFAGHPEQGGWDLATLAGREQLEWFDPAGLLLHEEDDHLLAFCWTRVHEEEQPPLGEIYVLAVDPRAQGRGLGQAILQAGLAFLAQRGLDAVILYVDEANGHALELYRREGFSVEQTNRSYLAKVPPAP